ncbi:tetratricopeptide repeat protein [Salipiger bermudensis]|uniref:tetratricopeptide repeat protein n=1 Tax=Salipiger bermudensis TaxID=344736 RepID=UPI001186E231|nr:tetratricopeptide repeat protein [Salipiger bermudensis]
MGMRRSEQEKQWRAKARAQSAEAVVNSDTAKLVAAALEAAAGNPGLQNVLTGPVLKGEEAAARAAVNAVTTWRETGTAPEDSNEALAFFTQMSFDTYIAALTEAERKVLAAACLFDAKVPVPRDAVAAAARALGVSDPEAGLGRLLALGLLDDFGAMAGWPGLEELPHLAANPLARPLAPRLHDDLRASAADVALPELARAWRDAKGNFARDQRATAACRLALHATAPEPEVLEAATVAAADYLFNRLGLACSALRLAKPALDRLTDARHDPSHPLSGLLINAARQAGDIAMQARLLEQALQSNTLDSGWRAFFLGLRADFLHDRGDLEQALRIYTDEVIPIHESLRNELSLAVSKGRVADLLEARGDLDDALRIRHEEELPVYEALGDRRSVAMTKLKIADVLEARGDLDEALRILKEEVLPVLEMVGDRREQAVTHGRIAGILEVRGNLDEALRIRTEEQLPIFVALNDKRSFAYTKLRIADCLENHGDFDEALRIRAEEALPLLEAIGDQRAIAVTKGKISDVYEVRGDLEEAMRLRSEEVLPAFEALEDRRSVAITKGRIADLLKIRGDLEGALRIRIEEELPVFQALEDKREQAITLGKIADILIACGDFDEALRILTEEALPIVAALGDKREQAVTHGKIADVLEARGDLDEGLRIRLEEELPVFDELRDKPQQDVTKGKIAEVLGAKGKIGAALDMHLSRLTDAEAMGMLDSLNHIRLSCARLRLQRGDHHIGGLKTIADELSMAWAGANQIGRPDVVGEVGSLFGPVLAMGGSRDQALEVLAAAASAWDMFGDTERAADCRQIIASIKGKTRESS